MLEKVGLGGSVLPLSNRSPGCLHLSDRVIGTDDEEVEGSEVNLAWVVIEQWAVGQERFGDDDEVDIGSDDLLLVPRLELFRGVTVELGVLIPRLEALVSLGALTAVAVEQKTCGITAVVAVINVPWLETSGILLLPRGILVEVCGIVLALE